jgi:RND superfamily putative drug exporter
VRCPGNPIVKMLAIGMAAAVLIDASVIRMILVPAVMSLLGRHAWWIPKWLDRITPNLDIEGSGHLTRIAREEQATLASSPTVQ